MKDHQFTLIVEGVDLQSEVAADALFAAGCDDTTIGRVGEVQYLDFDRLAASFAEAVLSAVETVEGALPGARVVHIDPDDLVTLSDIADRTGRTRESIRLLVAGERGPGGFPAPATHFRDRQRMWRWQEVAAWFAEHVGPTDQDRTRAAFITALNAVLTLRRTESALSDDDRRRIRSLVA